MSEEHIEDADVIADLSGGRLAVQAFRKRIADLQAENKRLREIIAREVDVGRADVDDIGIDAWIEAALKATQ